MNNLEWKILTIDNIPLFNEIIEVIASKLSFKNRKLSVLKLSSLEEGKKILRKNSDFALILVDAMMEDKNSGLEFIKYVRDVLKNQESRIILRTGYPDSVPEKNVINNYEIDGYISKEVNSQLQIEIAIITAIRNYYQILSTKETFQFLAGSIAHELRNPLNGINLAQNQTQKLLSSTIHNDKDLKEKLRNLSTLTIESVIQANHIINIILNDLSQKPINPAEFSYLNPSKILPEIIDKYGYQDEKEKEKIRLDLSKDFLFKAVSDRFIFIIYNLLKNALYYLDQYPNFSITIGSEVRKFDETEYNVIYVYDTGPGINPELMPKLFDNFYTSSKKGGACLGLPFCKRNMNLFGGDIVCESEFGLKKDNKKNGWTKFSLLFPVISEDEIDEIKFKITRRLLLVGNQKDISIYKSKIEKGLKDSLCDIAKNLEEILNLLKKTEYNLILIDIDIAKLNDFEIAKEIRNHDKEIPIIALTSLNKESFLKEAGDSISRNEINYYLSKSSKDNLLYRGISKWIKDPQDDLSYIGTKDDYLKILQGKKVILADDKQVNRLMTKSGLEFAGMIVTEVSDGKKLLEIYQKSLDKKGVSDFDAIITDVNMPPNNGDDIAKEIRNIESANKISHHDEMPIIALSGDGEKEDIYHFFKCQMTDYFIKGSNPELLLKIIANYLLKKTTEQDIENPI